MQRNLIIIVVMLFLIGLMIETLHAAELSVITSASTYSDGFTYTNQDLAIQVAGSGDRYWLAELRKISVCPYYCGFDLTMLGIGYGARYQAGPIKLFAQGGYYIVKAGGYFPDFDENLYYYMANKFGCGGQCTPQFYGFDVETKDAPFVAVGAEFPMSDNFSLRLSYQYLKIWTNYRAFVSPAKGYPELWHDPAHRNLSSMRVEVAYTF